MDSRLTMEWKSCKSPLRSLMVLITLVIGVLLGGLGYHLFIAYNTALEDAAQTTQNLARVLEEHTSRTVQAIDVMLKSVVDLVASQSLIHPLDTPDTQAFLTNFLTHHPQVRDIVMLNERGDMTHSARYRSYPESFNFADRAYFTVHRDEAGGGLYISPPLIARVDDRWFIALTRRLNRPDGRFAGVVMTVVEPDYFQDFYQTLEMGNGGSIALLMSDGTVMVHQPAIPSLRGEPVAYAPRLREWLTQTSSGTFQTKAISQDRPDIVSYRAIPEVPLVISVAMAQSQALEAWWYQVRDGALATGLTVLTILALSFILARRITQQAELNRQLHQREQEIQAILQAVPDTLATLDTQGRYQAIYPGTSGNPIATPATLLGRRIHDVLPRSLEGQIEQVLDRALASSQVQTWNYSLTLQGENKWFSARVVALQEQASAALLWLDRDITPRKQAEERLFEAKERVLVTLESIADAVITTDVQGIIEHLNPVAERLTGWLVEAARGQHLSAVLQLIDEHSREPTPDPVARCLAEERTNALADHHILINRQGREYVIQDSAAPIRSREEKVLGVVMVFRDVTEARRRARQMAHDATHDPLTGLVNRREFERRLEQALVANQAHRARHTLGYLDLDRFKIVNDTAGHAAGDQLLREITGLLREEIRERDTLARLGGDEFGLLLENCPLDKALAIAQGLVARVSDFRFVWEGLTFQIGVSIGLTAITAEAETIMHLQRQADTACYSAKKRGRNQVYIYLDEGSESKEPAKLGKSFHEIRKVR